MVALKLANPHETVEEPDLSEDSPVHYASLFVSFVLSNKSNARVVFLRQDGL